MGSMLMVLGKMMVCLILVLLVACGGTWARPAGDMDIPSLTDPNAIAPIASSTASSAAFRVEEPFLKTEDVKQGRAVDTAGAVNYQIFQQGKGTKKEPEKPKKERTTWFMRLKDQMVIAFLFQSSSYFYS